MPTTISMELAAVNVREAGKKISVLFVSVLGTIFLSSTAIAQAIPQKNVNVIGPTPVNWLLAGNPRMQQNEPECAVSPANTNWQFCGFNDYRAVNDPTIADVSADRYPRLPTLRSVFALRATTDSQRRALGQNPDHWPGTRLQSS